MLLMCGQAHAGAWTQPKGSGLYIENYNYYYTSEFVNNNGKRQSQPTYQKFELNPYLEYGLTDSITLGANIFLQYIRQDSSQTFTQQTGPFTSVTTTINGTQNNVGIGDAEFFVRKRLWHNDKMVISAEPMVKLPAIYSYTDNPEVGNKNADIGMSLSGGYSFKAYGRHHFANIDTRYRHRFGDQKDQVRIEATLGLSVSRDWMIMPQLFVTRRTSSPDIAVGFNETPANDYNLTKVQLTTLYYMWDETAIQLGGFYHVDAKNSSLGGGVLVALWETF